jgi:hypothetical protein
LTGGDASVAETGVDTSISDAPNETTTTTDAPIDVTTGDATDGATCSCTNLVSAYRFTNANALGHDYMGNNDFALIEGSPKQSTTVPAGFSGYSLSLDGSSGVCLSSVTFDITKDHTVCWWSMPTTLANQTNQFAQNCNYDTWTTNSGTDYEWRINNCNTGTTINFDVANVFTANTWVQICQTYQAASMTRTVIINGQIGSKHVTVDSAPILQDTQKWCIGSYDGGGFWTGLIYLPLWFNRALSDQEIQSVNSSGCCLP